MPSDVAIQIVKYKSISYAVNSTCTRFMVAQAGPAGGGGYPGQVQLGGGYPSQVQHPGQPGGYPILVRGGYPIQVQQGGVPLPGTAGGPPPGWEVPHPGSIQGRDPTWPGGYPIQVQLGGGCTWDGAPPMPGLGYPPGQLSGQGRYPRWGTPGRDVKYPPPAGMGYPPGTGQQMDYLIRRQSVWLLRSRRRNFLLLL